jgi:hypothetical protein
MTPDLTQCGNRAGLLELMHQMPTSVVLLAVL